MLLSLLASDDVVLGVIVLPLPVFLLLLVVIVVINGALVVRVAGNEASSSQWQVTQ